MIFELSGSRIKYHQCIISLFSLFLEQLGGTSPSWSGQARRTRIQSAKQIATYLRVQWQSYGPKQIPCDMVDAVYVALLALLVDLDDDESIEAFVELCRFLGAFRQRLQRADNMIQKLEGTAKESKIKLPPKAVSILELVLTPIQPESNPH